MAKFLEDNFMGLFALLSVPCWMNHITFFITGNWVNPSLPFAGLGPIGVIIILLVNACVIFIFPLFSILWLAMKAGERQRLKAADANTSVAAVTESKRTSSWMEMLKHSSKSQK